MTAGLDLRILACRFSLRALQPLSFPVPASNRFRGALGFQLPEELFRPTAGDGPSGLRDRPRPFVLRCHALDGRSMPDAGAFTVDLHIFTGDSTAFTAAFDRLGWARFEGVQIRTVQVSLVDTSIQVKTQRLSFLTPTELKPHTGPEPPPFSTVVARACERISALRTFYGGGPLDFDFRSLVNRAADVRCTGGEIRWNRAERRSGRTGQVHPLGGFTGWAEYAGDLTEFQPWLEAAAWTGVGRQTVWGKGVMALSPAE